MAGSENNLGPCKCDDGCITEISMIEVSLPFTPCCELIGKRIANVNMAYMPRCVLWQNADFWHHYSIPWSIRFCNAHALSALLHWKAPFNLNLSEPHRAMNWLHCCSVIAISVRYLQVILNNQTHMLPIAFCPLAAEWGRIEACICARRLWHFAMKVECPSVFRI